MARSVVNPSLRTASCCKVEVVKGAEAWRCLRFLSTWTTVALSPPLFLQIFDDIRLRGFRADAELVQLFALVLEQLGGKLLFALV